MQLLNAITNRPWVIEPSYLQLIIDVVTGERRDEDLAAQIAADREQRPAALAMRRGEPLPNTRGVTVRDGVAHVAITGPIVRYSDIFSRVSGLASIEQTSADISAALDSPEVRALIVELDTPGGEVTGVAALAEQLYQARGVKPVYAYVDGMAASAGYWIGSAASRIVTDPAGLLGSIGAVLAVRDPASGPKMRPIEFVSSQSPYKRANPTSDEGRAQYQRIVDQTAEAFIEAVARHRGVTAADVVERYGAGGLLVGRHAVEAGLADEVGTFETTLAALAGQRERNRMDWKQMWAGFFGAAQDAGALVAQDDTPPAVAASLMAAEPPAAQAAVTTSDPAVAERLAMAEQRVKEAEAKAQALEAQARDAALASFVASAITSGKALPAEREALTALYAKAQGAGLTAEVEALISARPAHQLTAELLPAGAVTLPAQRSATGDELTAERRRELLSATPEGRAALAREATK